MIELKHRRSARERHYQLPNGQMRAEVGSADINYLNHDGRGDGETGWRKVDINPVQTESGWVQEFCHYRMVAPLTADGVASYSQTWGDGKIKNRGVTFQAVGALPVQGVRGMLGAAQAVIYTDAFGDGADLIYCFYVSGIGKYVRVRAGYTGTSYQFKVGTNASVVRMGQNAYEVQRAGKKTLDTPRMTSIGGDLYLRPITARWGDNSVALPVEIEPIAGGWVVTKTTPQAWDGGSDLLMDLTTTGTLAANANSCVFYSVASASPSDANWQSCRTATAGSLVDSGDPSSMFITSYYRTSTSVAYRIWRGFLAWSLSIPGATITAADIVLNVSAANGTRRIHAVSSTFASTSSLTVEDYDQYGTTSFGDQPFNNASTGNKTITLNASGISHIDAGGTTKFCIISEDDLLNTAYTSLGTSTTSTYNTTIGSYESGTAPILNITYNPPAAGGVPSGLMLMGVG